MNADVISHYTKLPLKEVQHWVNQSSLIVYNDKKYISALEELDVDYLEETLPLVHQAYEKHLDAIKSPLAAHYQIDVGLMTASTLSDWVIGVLRYPESSYELRGKHKRIVGAIIQETLQDLLDILEELPEGSAEWQQALCLLSFPLMKK